MGVDPEAAEKPATIPAKAGIPGQWWSKQFLYHYNTMCWMSKILF